MTRTCAIANPVEIQVISCSVAPTEPRMCPMATFTIELSMAPMRVPKVTLNVTSHLLTGGRAARRTVGLPTPGPSATEVLMAGELGWQEGATGCEMNSSSHCEMYV